MGNSLSWLKSLVKGEELRIIMNGLDAAGKTTILYRMKLGEVVTTIPTIGFNVETVQYKNISFTCWDVGGRDKIRPLWRHYYQNTQVIMQVVDSNDRERVDEARDELHRLMREDELRDCLLLVVANKQDLENCMTVEELREKLEFDKLSQFKYKAIMGTTATTGEGLDACLNWISTNYQLKKLGSPIEETYQDVKSLSLVGSNYVSTYLNNLTQLAYKVIGSQEEKSR